MPRIRSKQIIGETPTLPEHIVNKGYVDNLLGISGGTATSLTIEDEYNHVLSGVTTINFIGVDVSALVDGDGSNRRVNVYIPTPTYSSHFNTTDGTTDAGVPNVSTTNRYVAIPDIEGTPYKVGNWTGGVQHNTIRSSVSTLSYTTNGNFSISDTSTQFVATVFDADGSTPLATHSMTLNGNSTQTQQNITIVVSNWSSDADKYKASVTVNIGISTILPQGGRFSIRLRHTNGDGTYDYTQSNIFRDTETLTASVGGALTIVPYNPVVKQISGVYYYTLNSEWNVNIPNINNLNSRSYPVTPQLSINDNDLIFSTQVLEVNGEGGVYDGFDTGTWTRQHDTTNASYTKLDWTTDQTNQMNWNHLSNSINTPQATATVYDWVSISVVNSPIYNYLIDTLVDSSSRNSEMFRTESNALYPRLQSDLSTPWDETSDLGSIDGGTGLQILGDRLVYPQSDFQSLEPNIASQPNYTTSSGDKSYYREFETNGSNASNGIIEFSGHNITEADLLSGDVRFDITIDNGTSWFSLNSQYTGGILTDGDGCRVNVLEYGLGSGSINNSALNFTLGLGGSSTNLYLRITFTSSASDKYIGGLDFIDGNWI